MKNRHFIEQQKFLKLRDSLTLLRDSLRVAYELHSSMTDFDEYRLDDNLDLLEMDIDYHLKRYKEQGHDLEK